VRITLAQSALEDLEQILSFYEDQGVSEVGERLVSELIEKIEHLREHPEMGRVVPEFETPRLRELIHSPFRIVYRRDAKIVRVIRVWRSERLLKLP
jgi:toxin ParE1/3/4